MAMEKFKAAPIPAPTLEYEPQHFRQVIRVLETYFSQLDSKTPMQNDSYRADNFFGGVFNGDVQGGDVNADNVTTHFLSAYTAQILEAIINRLYADDARLASILNSQQVSNTVMGNTFYGGLFHGEGYGLKLPHITASDSTDQVAGGDDTPTVVNWNTLDSGYEWTLDPPGSATADVAGVYTIRYSLQFINTANSIQNATVWLKVNNSDAANSATIFAIPARKSASEFGFVCGYSEATFTVDVGDEVELYWATDLAGNPVGPVDGVYIFHDAAQVSPFARPAIPSAIGSITFVSALNQTKVAPLPVFGFGKVGQVTVVTT